MGGENESFGWKEKNLVSNLIDPRLKPAKSGWAETLYAFAMILQIFTSPLRGTEDYQSIQRYGIHFHPYTGSRKCTCAGFHIPKMKVIKKSWLFNRLEIMGDDKVTQGIIRFQSTRRLCSRLDSHHRVMNPSRFYLRCHYQKLGGGNRFFARRH